MNDRGVRAVYETESIAITALFIAMGGGALRARRLPSRQIYQLRMLSRYPIGEKVPAPDGTRTTMRPT
jgi:hypothetical protein